jgi:DNA helicase-4
MRLAADLKRFVNTHLFDLLAVEPGQVTDLDVALRAITEHNPRYLAHSDLARAIADVPGKAAVALAHPLFDPEVMPPNLKASLPASLAFVTDPGVAKRTSAAVAIAMLFACGYAWGRYAGLKAWRSGLVMVALGLVVEAAVIALGG